MLRRALKIDCEGHFWKDLVTQTYRQTNGMEQAKCLDDITF